MEMLRRSVEKGPRSHAAAAKPRRAAHTRRKRTASARRRVR
jgi:hypothetical protein